MNQILISENKKSNNSKKADINKIMIFFAIIVIIFALALVGYKAYNLIKDKMNKPEIDTTLKPEATIKKDGDKVKITVNHNQAINYIDYIWNDEETETIDGDGRNNIQEEIEIPEGNNILKVLVVDISGNKTEYEEEIIYSISGDIEKPKIEVTNSATPNHITVTATDETEISHIKYRWNDGEETIVDKNLEQEDKTELQTEIKVEKGQNEITIIAVDQAGNEEQITKTISGIPEPIITVTQEGNEVVFTVEAEDGVKYIDLDLNDGKYRLEPEEMMYEVNYRMPLEQTENGENIVIIHVYSVNGNETHFEGIAHYLQ